MIPRYSCRVVLDDPARQLLEDGTVHEGAVTLRQNEDFEPEVSKARPVEAGFHHGRGDEQSKGVRAVSDGCLSTRIDDVELWDADGVLHLGRHLVHRVRGQDQELGTGALEPPRCALIPALIRRLYWALAAPLMPPRTPTVLIQPPWEAP